MPAADEGIIEPPPISYGQQKRVLSLAEVSQTQLQQRNANEKAARQPHAALRPEATLAVNLSELQVPLNELPRRAMK